MSVMILPAAIVVCLFSPEILLLWTHDPLIVKNTHVILSILIIGTALNGLMNLPYGLQLAHAWTGLVLYTNIIASVLLVPMIYFLATRYGSVGGAWAWVALNSGYVLIVIQIMHQRLLPKEKWRWYGKDVGLPLLIAILTAGLGRFLISGPLTQPMMLLSLGVISVVTLCTTALVTPSTRVSIFALISRTKAAYGSS